jgi:glycosyltransferase involved in cell wall biosynthesis
MKKILVFNDGLEMGGTEKLLVSLLNHLAEKSCNVTLLLPRPSVRNILLREVPSYIKVKYLSEENTSYAKAKLEENLLIFFPRLYARLKKIKLADFDQIICFKDSVYARLFSKTGKPKILWIHNILYRRQYEVRSFKERLSVWLNKRQIKLAERSYTRFDKVICVSDACKNAFLDVIYGRKTPKQIIRVLYNAVDLSEIAKQSKEVIPSVPQDRVNFILVTRQSPDKRNDRLINAAQRLNDEGYSFHAYIMGAGMDSEDMKNTVAQRGLMDKITLMGRVDNPYPYILQSNWLLCVSERESFSLTLLEAMSLKTPVITTGCGGPADIVERGKYGILVDNSSEGVYSGMKMVLDDPALSVKYSADLDEAVARYDYQHWLSEIDSLISI